MPEFSNYLENLDPVVGALSGDEILGASKDGGAVSLTAQQIADLGGGGRVIPFGATTGDSTYSVTMSPVVSAYENGKQYVIRIGTTSSTLVTVDMGPGAKKVLLTSGGQASSQHMIAGVDYLISYNSALDSAAGAFVVVNELQHGLMNARGDFDASSNLFPSVGGSGISGGIRHGDIFRISVAGTLGGSAVNIGDFITTSTDAPGQTASAWYIIPGFNSLALKAPLASPTFTGTPAAPNPAAATKTTQIPTTAWVLSEMPYSVAASDEVTPITASDRITFPWPFPGTTTLVNVIGFLGTPQTSGSIFTVDIEKNGTTILSTLLTIDNTEYNSSTAATPVVISVSSIAFLDRITIVVTQVGDNTAKGLKIIFVR